MMQDNPDLSNTEGLEGAGFSNSTEIERDIDPDKAHIPVFPRIEKVLQFGKPSSYPYMMTRKMGKNYENGGLAQVDERAQSTARSIALDAMTGSDKES